VQTTTSNTPTVTKHALPAWRRPASHSLTRAAKDAIFPAAKNGNLPLLKTLLSEGGSVNYQNFNGETVLHIAASRGDLAMVKYLVNKGANVNAMTGKKWRPIHHAMRFDHPQVANYLLAHNASVAVKTSDGLTALALAKTSKKSGMQQIIKRYSR
jgi:ankyrin repeat protein